MAQSREEISAYNRAYYEAHKQQIAERVRAYRAAHKEKYKRFYDEWRAIPANKDWRNNYQCSWFRKERESHPARYLLGIARRRARALGRDFNLEESDIVVGTHCPLLGVPMQFGGPRDFWPSLDRIDVTKGYVKGNVQVISHRANRIKSDSNGDELLTLALHVLKAEGRLP